MWTRETWELIWVRRREGKNFPIVRGEAEVLGVGPEELLGTLMSVSARREWDPRFGKSEVMSMENEAEHSVLVEVRASSRFAAKLEADNI